MHFNPHQQLTDTNSHSRVQNRDAQQQNHFLFNANHRRQNSNEMQILKNNATNALMATHTAAQQDAAHNNDKMADQETNPLPQASNAQLLQSGNAQLLPQKSKVCFNII
jgi:hypothetical protein